MVDFGSRKLTKGFIESEVGEFISDAEFNSICREIEGRIENLFDELIGEIVENLKEGYSYSKGGIDGEV